MSSIAINGALIVTQNETREVIRGSVLVVNDRIEYVGQTKQGADEEIDGNGFIVLPGFINTHAHVAMSHMKGQLDDIDLETFLRRTYQLDAERSEKGIYNSAVLGISEMIDAGITCFADMYYSEDVIARACQDSGIRANLAWNTLDRELTTQRGDPVSNAGQFISSFKGKELITPSIGIQGIYAASDETIARAIEVSRSHGTLVHMHLSETRKEVYDFVKKNNQRIVEHLSDKNLLPERLLAAHGVWLTLREIRLLSRAHSSVSWNSLSNAKLASGGMPAVPEMMSNGITVSLGTDSSASNNSLDMFQLMKFSSLMTKNARWDSTVIPAQVSLDMATVNGARAIGNTKIGSIEAGKKADLVLIDATRPNLIPTGIENAVSNIVYSANAGNVDSVIIDGKFVKRHGKLTNVIRIPHDDFV
ncbi:MAG: amidohydrolase family protein [Candidatus Thermoplasmatota archaeon]|nr:amidohydrolase family protein [Candidatus Thermoplasmatota archaeon]